MKAFFLVFLVLTSNIAHAVSPLGWERKRPATAPKHDPKEDQKTPAYNDLFFNTRSTAPILHYNSPSFLSLEDVKPLTDEFETIGTYEEPTSLNIVLPGFLYPKRRLGFGLVSGGLQGEAIVEGGSKAMIRVIRPVVPGESYTVLRPGRVRKDLDGKSWFPYAAAGVIDIESLEDKDRAVVVVRVGKFVRTGDLIVPLIPLERTIQLSRGERKPYEGKAHIVSLSGGVEYAGEGQIVFLDQGSQSGLTTNQILDLFKNPEVRKSKSKQAEQVGSLIIVDLHPQSSTAFVLSSHTELHIGDYAANSATAGTHPSE